MSYRSVRAGILAVAVLAACSPSSSNGPSNQDPDQSKGLPVVMADSASLSARVSDLGGQEIGIDPSDLPEGVRAQAALEVDDLLATFLLRASVAPPTVNNVRLEATHVVIEAGYAYVSYMVHGEQTVGAVDVFDITNPSAPKLVSSVTLPNTEVAALTVKNGFVYLAGATDDPAFKERAVLGEITLTNKLLSTKSRMVGVPSYFATGVAVQNNRIYVTSGSGGPNTGGLTILDPATLNKVSGGEAFLDARDVSASGTAFIAAVQGGPAKLRLYTPSSGSLAKMVSLPGGTIPESKSGVAVRDPWAFVATGDGGLQLVDMTLGSIVASLPRPSRSGVAPEDAVTNSVSLMDDLVFTADGGAGVNVSMSNYRLLGSGLIKPFLLPLGRLDMPGSANFVAASSTSMFIADGSGGLQIVQVVLK